MKSLAIKALFVAVLTLLCAGVAFAKAPASSNPSQQCTNNGNIIFPGEPPISHGGCTSANTSGDITGAGYASQCKNLANFFGGYPFTFYGDPGEPTVHTEGECVNTLRSLHTTYGG